jgi:hypothetical protein
MQRRTGSINIIKHYNTLALNGWMSDKGLLDIAVAFSGGQAHLGTGGLLSDEPIALQGQRGAVAKCFGKQSRLVIATFVLALCMQWYGNDPIDRGISRRPRCIEQGCN